MKAEHYLEEPEEADGAHGLHDARLEVERVVRAQVELNGVHADALHHHTPQRRDANQRHLAQVVP